VRSIVYVEGGGRQRKTLDDCRRGFGQLFEKFVLEGDRPKVIACGERRSTFRDFQVGIKQGKGGFLVLLVDSEGPVGPSVTSWAYLNATDRWQRPAQARNDQAHLMVQCMESWFVADRQALADYYGQGFLINALPDYAKVEEIPKQDIQQRLKHATAPTQKGQYHKTRHGFELLAVIDPAKIRWASSHAQKLFEVLEAKARA
jgi:hypothetical protein